MIRAHSVDAVRAAEAAAMSGLPEGELMARAARGLAEVAIARLTDTEGATVVGLVGAGANGGDTLYAVAHLAESGFACAVVLVPTSGRDGVHAAGLDAAEAAGVMVHVASDDPDAATHVVAEADVVLDGIVGIGGRPGLRPEAAKLVDAVDDDAWVIAVDLASGLDPAGEDGEDDAVWADETVTFGTPKPVHLLPAGEAATGRLTVVDIGLDVDDVPAAVERLTWDDVADLWPVPGRGDDKYSRGVLGVVAGSEAYPGAAVLCTTAAAESGVGMVRYVGTPTPVALVHQAVPEAVVGDGRVQAWVVGPGLDTEADDDRARAQLETARAALASDLPVVVDAGGLALVEGRREAPTVLTPHAGELARLLTRLASPSAGTDDGASGDSSASVSLDDGGSPVISPADAGSGPDHEVSADDVTADDVTADPLGHARRLVALTGATVLLKGATTLVVTDGEPVRSQADAPPWLATAGSGDVLAGVIGTLLAAGCAPHDAAALGALVHGVAADRASGGGPLRALAVAHGIRPTVRDLLARGRSAPG
ncbi:bifunctional ADP-dependent NAD(P)H-hydrate dehydratase/NAD(P)H-hydrate epimerase [Terrabacter sp. MAHUQ-38]|uniref:bifunctional ADP-dependent NAD(P)H-hydrate dehydratase/NAD(P)H-hydrate epimerase n=1 Tax=unclassified Terrabacter TaxID=2630222 RepID=UPI00165E6F2D|nr:bifunctional ADP-dependent NAD(P)H-hydrate dehydratase/NAD(P)H-hydrate epimerase [Terrabacter sp. MAHUQ-38]MBC9822029.1 bifunctional ADP-dependent NAD(P)H-hydrate dehydratase/NAD(P)H-hydrate epimerase [Terrabacter sp. MAHUQ-38]